MGFEELKAKVADESLVPPLEMVWCEGMASWLRPDQVDGLTEEEDRASNPLLDEWYYQKNGEKVGPVTAAELKDLIADPSIDPPLKMVWREGYRKWQPVYKVADLWEPIPGLKVEIQRKRIVPKSKAQAESDLQEPAESPDEQEKAALAAREWALADAKRAAERAKAEGLSGGRPVVGGEGLPVDLEARLEQLLREEIAARGLVPRAQQLSDEEKALAAAKERAELEVKAAEAAKARAAEEIRAIVAAKERAQEETKAMEVAKARAEAEQMAATAARERAAEEIKAMEAAQARAVEETKAIEAKERAEFQARQAREAEAKAREALRIAEIKLQEQEHKIQNEARLAHDEEFKKIRSEQEVITAAELMALEQERQQARTKAREESDRLSREIEEARRLADAAAKEAEEARRLAALEAKEAELARLAAAKARQEEEDLAAAALRARQAEEAKAAEAAAARQLEEQKIEAAAKAREAAEAQAKLAGEAKLRAEREALEAEQARLLAAREREEEERRKLEELERYRREEEAAKALEMAMRRAVAEAEEARLAAEQARAEEEARAAEAMEKRKKEEALAATAMRLREAEELKAREAAMAREAEEVKAHKAKILAESHAAFAAKAQAKALKASMVVEAKQEQRALTETQRLVLEKKHGQAGAPAKGAQTQRLEDEKARREAALEEIRQQAKQLAVEIEEAKREAAEAAKEAEEAKRKAELEARQAEEARLAAAKARAEEEAKARAALRAREEEEAKMAVVAKARAEEEARAAAAKQARDEAEQRARAAEKARRLAAPSLRMSHSGAAGTKDDSMLDHMAREANELRKRIMEKLWRETTDADAESSSNRMALEQAQQQWYYTFEGDRLGPVSFDELKSMAHAGSLDPRLDMAWHSGMEKWIQAGLVDGLFQRVAPVSVKVDKAAPPPPPSRQAFKAKKLPKGFFEEESEPPGLGRFPFIGLSLGFPIVTSYLLLMGRPFLTQIFGDRMIDAVFPYTSYAMAAIMVLIAFKRLSNLGMSRVWVLAMIIPPLNFWLAYRCVACPSGYGYGRKMDAVGYALAVVFWLFVLGVFWMLSFNLGSLMDMIEGQRDLPEKIQSLIRHFNPPAGKPAP